MKIKQLVAFFLFAFYIGIVPNPTFAAGKIENATMEEVVYAMNTTIELAEKSLAALDDGADADTVLDMLKETKQMHKRIEIIRLGAIKSKAATQMRKARSAAKKKDLETTRAHLVKGIEHYHTLRKKFYDF